MEFKNKPPKWGNEGIEPLAEEIQEGYEVGDKVPAPYLNYHLHQTGECVEELQNKLKNEETERKTANTSLQNAIDKEKSNRENFEKNTSQQFAEIEQSLQGQGGGMANHTDNKNNPHEVTAEQVGLGNVENTKDSEKRVAYANEAGTGRKVANPITIKINGGSTEGVDMVNYDGSNPKSLNITFDKLGGAKDDLSNVSENARENLGVYGKGEVYNKNEVCTDGTLNLFGASQPNNILEMFGKHWWKRRVIETGEAIVEELNIGQYQFTAKGSTGSLMTTLYYANSYTLNQEGYELVNPVKFELSYTSGSSAQETFNGKYYMIGTTKGDTVYYCGTVDDSKNFNASYTYNSSTETYIVTFQGVTTRTYQVKTYETLGEWEFVLSTDPNAYPTGESGMFYYEYLGVPFTNAREGAKIEKGTYIGTGEYKSSSPNILTFNFVPKIVIVTGDEIFGNYLLVMMNGSSTVNAFPANSTGDKVFMDWNNKTVTWYATYNASQQCNSTNTTYHYVAIG